MIEGKKHVETEQGSFAKIYGIGLFEICGVNMTNEQLKKEGFYVKEEDLEAERQFVTERDGVDVVRLEFALKEVKSENPLLRKISFFIENKDKESMNNPGSFQWINNQGNTSYDGGKGEEGLQGWFKNGRDVRKAKAGEAEFMEFMRNCMAVDFKEGGTLSYNLSKFFKGDFRELQGDLKSDYLSTVIVALTIKERDVEEDEVVVKKEYENFYNKAFAPGSQWKFMQNKKEFNDGDVAKILGKVEKNKEIRLWNKENPDAKKKYEFMSPLEKMIADMANPEYPCKDRVYFGILKEYTGEEGVVGAEKEIFSSNSDY